jgi:hypothetical protein
MSKFRVAVRSLDYPLPQDPDEGVPTPVGEALSEPSGAERYFD